MGKVRVKKLEDAKNLLHGIEIYEENRFNFNKSNVSFLICRTKACS